MSKDAAVTLSPKRSLPEKLPMQHRSFAVRAEDPGDDGRIALKFSSPNPVKRMTWGSMWWNEVLSHAPGAVNTERLEQGVALLVNHDTNQRAGILEDAKITKDGGTGFARYNSTQKGKDTETEVREKTLPWISVGYIVHSEARVADIDPADDEDPDYLGTYEADSWEPVEVSHVAIPADPTVGVGRDLSHLPQYPVRFAGMPASPPAAAARSNQEKTMELTEVTPAATNVQVLSNDALRLERERTAGIRALARQFPDVMTRDFEEKAIGEGMTRDSVAAVILEKKREKEAAVNAGGQIQLSSKERSQYDVMRLFRNISAPLGVTPEEAGFELEVSRTLAKKLGREGSGVLIPTTEPIFRLTSEEIRQRTIVAGAANSTTGGGATVATELVSFLDFLRAATRLTALGADFMGGCSSNFALPKMTGDTGFNWVGENPGTDNSDVDPTFGQVPFAPLGATASTSWSRQLMVQSGVDIEAKVRNSLVRTAAIAIEKAALQGSGGTQPTGVLTTTGVNVISIGTNGGAPTKQHFIDMLTQSWIANADLGEQKYLLTSLAAGYLSGIPEMNNTIALPTFAYGSDGKGRINGHDAYWSNLLPTTLTKGTATGVCHAALGGFWGALTIAEWGAMEIITDPYTKAKQQLIGIIANFLVDSNLTYPQAMSCYLDAVIPNV